MHHTKSFIEVAPESDFSIHNLPYGIFTPKGSDKPRVGVAIGEYVLDLSVLNEAGLLSVDSSVDVFQQSSLNALINLGRDACAGIRRQLQLLLSDGNPQLRDDAKMREMALIAQDRVTMLLPLEIPGYTDFYASKEHATNVGTMFRDPANALLPNWTEIPIGYNGRASSIVVSGTPVRRPLGQIKLPDAERPMFTACRKLDFELETAFVIGKNSSLGDPVAVNEAEDYIFGMVLLNDWSARDIQQWEYVPLGPFNSKTFASSISPWVVPMEALAPFRVQGPTQTPEPLSYLSSAAPSNFDIELKVEIQPQNSPATTICQTNFKYMYWSMAQQLAHHTVSGCNVRIGDLMGSGTISGSTPDSFGSLLELTWNGKNPLTLVNGQTRAFIEDNDTIRMTGFCQGDGYRVGFGEVVGKVLPAHDLA